MPLLIFLLLSAASLILLRPEAAPPPPPPQVPPPPGATHALFETADRCQACHNGVTTPSGVDVSIGFDWRASMMANSARDPYWQAAVRRETMDHPGASEAIEDKCATCHMPMMRYEAHLGGVAGSVFDHLPADGGLTRPAILAADGVSCSVCHQISEEGLGDPSSFTGGFKVDELTPWGTRSILGPFTTDAGRAAIMNSATGFTPREAPHIQSSELCASCHTLYTETLDEEGNEVGRFPEQVPYLEWRQSAFADEGQSCQSCHMPVVQEPVAVTGVLGQPREEVSRHVFRGGNFFMLGMLKRYRDELGVTALPQELEVTRLRTLEFLASRSAVVTVEQAWLEGGHLLAEIGVENLGGHKLPTAYPSRRVWLRLVVRDRTGAVVFESGALRPDGSIAGNRNDEDPALFEPHHDLIERPDQVQIWESVLADHRGQVTTGLLRAASYIKDNRILPRGLEVADAHPDVGVYGAAREDPTFRGGGDRVRVRVPVPAGAAPFTVEAELWYQPIGFRWAKNLEEYQSFETDRFVRYYGEMSEGSGTVLARAASTVR